MNTFFELLLVGSLIGAVDTLYFHAYRFRLFAQPGSVAEEVTHLARHALFLAIVLVSLLAPPWARPAVLVLFVADLVNAVADVLLERSSRAPLGGLPSGEYLLHILGTMLTGIAVATYWWTEPTALSTSQLVRGWATVAMGSALFATEAALFARAVAFRRSAASVEGEPRLQG